MTRILVLAGVAIVMTGCSSGAAPSLGPNDPRFAKAVDAAQTYAAAYYHLSRKECGAAAGFHFGVRQDGDRLIVNMTPPKPRHDAVRLSLRSDMSLIEMRPLTS